MVKAIWTTVWAVAAVVMGTAFAGEPQVSLTRFKNIPSQITYFDDTTVSHRVVS